MVEMQFQTVRQTVMSGQVTVRVGGWGVGRKQFAREVDWRIVVTGVSRFAPVGLSDSSHDGSTECVICAARPGGWQSPLIASSKSVNSED